MNTAAHFIYNKSRGGQNRTVRLYASRPKYATSTRGLTTVDVVGLPLLTRMFQRPWQAVAYFSGLREMSWKDGGASEVDWGGYEDLARHWPTEATPWDMRVG